MKKVLKSAIIAVLVLGAVVVGMFAFLDYQKNHSPIADEQFDALQVSVFDTQLEQTDFDDIFFSQEKGLFYQYEQGAFKEYPQEVRSVQLALFGETLTFELHLIKKGDVYFGFGNAKAAVVDYFIKAMNVPSASKFDKTNTILLLLDGTKSGMQSQRFYSDAFAYSLTTNTVLGLYLGDRLRPVTDLGVKRSDYIMFTTEMIQKSSPLRMHFLTRAVYEQSKDPYRLFDLNTTDTWYYVGYSPDSTLQDIILNYAYDTEGGIFHFKRGEGEFYSKIGIGAPTDKIVCTFTGDYINDYVRQGDFLINKEQLKQGTFAVTNARTGERTNCVLPKAYREIYSVTMNEQKTKLVILGAYDWTSPKGETYDYQLVSFVELATSKVTQYSGITLFDTSNPLVSFTGNTAFFLCDGKLCKFEIE